MKNNLKIIGAIFLAAMTVSCNKFLATKPYSYVEESEAVQTYDDAKYALIGIYDAIQSYNYYGRDYIIFGDAYTDNIVLSPTNSSRFVSEAQWTVMPTTGDMQYFWQRAYVVINRSNSLLASVDKMEASDAEKAEIKGQILAIRALAHFDLVRFFGQTYKGNESTAGVPYMDKSIIYDKPARNTVQEVYTNVIKDFTDAITLLKGAPDKLAPYNMNYWAAQALLARVYMTQLDYDKAKPILDDIIKNSGYSLLPNSEFAAAWTKSYNAADKKEFIFAINSRPDDYAATSCLGYLYVQPGYGDLRVPDGIMALYTKDDVRNTWFKAGTAAQIGYTFVNKYPGKDGTYGLSDSPVVRYSDVLLMGAEANVMGSVKDEVAAIKYLDMVRQRSDINAPATTTTGEDLINAIALERRKEFVYEGHYMFDLKRYKKDINSGLRSNNTLYTTIKYPDTRLAMPIPQVEIDANPNMVQNPGY